MSDVIKFCCENCRKLNKLNKSQIDEAIKMAICRSVCAVIVAW